MRTLDSSAAYRRHLREEISNLKFRILTLETSQDLLKLQRSALVDRQMNGNEPKADLDALRLRAEEKLQAIEREHEKLHQSRLTLINRLRTSYAVTNEVIPTSEAEIMNESDEIVQPSQETWPLVSTSMRSLAPLHEENPDLSPTSTDPVFRTRVGRNSRDKPDIIPRIFEKPRAAPITPGAWQHSRSKSSTTFAEQSPKWHNQGPTKSFSLPSNRTRLTEQCNPKPFESEIHYPIAGTTRRLRQLSLNKALPQLDKGQESPVLEQQQQQPSSSTIPESCSKTPSKSPARSANSEKLSAVSTTNLSPPLQATHRGSPAELSRQNVLENFTNLFAFQIGQPKRTVMDTDLPIVGPALNTIRVRRMMRKDRAPVLLHSET